MANRLRINPLLTLFVPMSPNSHTSYFLYTKKQFGIRWAEWLMSCWLVCVGWVILLPDQLYQSHPDMYTLAAQIVDEQVLGTVVLFMGCFRLSGLIVNGLRRRITPWIRWCGSVFGFFVGLFLLYNYALSNVYGLWVVMVGGWCIIEVVNVYRTIYDAQMNASD